MLYTIVITIDLLDAALKKSTSYKMPTGEIRK